MNILNLFSAMPGAVAQGLIWGITAIGIYITYRILDIADLTVDGSLCTGGAVCLMPCEDDSQWQGSGAGDHHKLSLQRGCFRPGLKER